MCVSFFISDRFESGIYVLDKTLAVEVGPQWLLLENQVEINSRGGVMGHI